MLLGGGAAAAGTGVGERQDVEWREEFEAMFVEVNKGLDSMLGDSREWIDVDIIMDEKEKERIKYAMHRVLVYRGMIHVPVEIVETMNYMCAILEEMG